MVNDQESELQTITVYTEKEVYEHIPVGHPYRPKKSAILFLKKGKIILKEQISVVEIHENSVVLINMKSVYELLEISKDIEIRSIAYNRSFIEKVSLKLNRLNLYNNLKKQLSRNFPLKPEEFSILWDNTGLLSQTLKSQDKIEFSQEIGVNYLSIIIYFLMSFAPFSGYEQQGKMSRSQQIVYDFIMLVSEHYLTHKSVQFYAQKLGISMRHLSSVLKQENGKTANEIISEFILNEAKAQLSGTSKSINTIADNLQISDSYSFSHFFKKHQKISPIQYRKQFL
ncbi:helix-turn-helix transcriptional regulator [Chryseobacterium manosquense]|uniref:Helix-turn-helix transcriptional regulator n=1 Tax=Chryseobacterium manosquense TaxID=2754694 RepID=A0A7H1E0D6_9FLAO|nr:helix-turn-helix transcriptional regulator [Chryseobacterium manosquense]ROI11779.1 AraC family transcriptional regulator [Kaistella haifensis]